MIWLVGLLAIYTAFCVYHLLVSTSIQLYYNKVYKNSTPAGSIIVDFDDLVKHRMQPSIA